MESLILDKHIIYLQHLYYIHTSFTALFQGQGDRRKSQ